MNTTMIRKFFTFFIIFCLQLSLVACEQYGTPEIITPDGDHIRIEMALTQDEREKGLMFRESLDEDSGMLFVFDDEMDLAFWMKNTLIPLDVIYIDSGQRIVDIKTMQPCPQKTRFCPSYPSESPAQFALEINAGRAAELNLSIGDTLTFHLPENAQSK